MVLARILVITTVTLTLFACDRREKTTSPASLATVALHSDSSDSDEALLTTEMVSEAVQVTFNNDHVPVFRAVEGGFELLTDCEYSGGFQYKTLSVSHSGTRRETVSGATLRVMAGAAEVMNAGVDRQQKHQVEVSKAGYYQLLGETPTIVDTLDCPQATHVAKMIYVGAFSELRSKRGGGSVRAGTDTLGGGGGLARSHRSSLSVGDLSECTAEKIKQSPEAPPYGCDAPIRVKVVPIRKALRYYFDHRTVVGSHSREAVVTASELAELAKLLEDALRERGGPQGVDLIPVSNPDEADVRCGVVVDTESRRYALECGKGNNKFAQEEGEPAALSNTAWAVARSLLPNTGEVQRDPKVGRLVILVDVSSSMVVNDEQTFMYDDVRRSIRYGLVDAMFDGLLMHDISPQVSLMAFAGSGCVKSADVGGDGFATLALESKRAELQWLEGVLEVSPCADGTDIVSALREAKSILDGSARPDAGHDAVVLITDGSHRGRTSTTVRDAATELIDGGVDLHVIRVQLNDIEKFRGLMNDRGKRKKILARWSKFSGESDWEKSWGTPPEKLWKKEISGVSSENEGGAGLLDDLRSVGISTLVLNDDDRLRDPLITVHRLLLPKMGARPTIDATKCDPPTKLRFPDGIDYWQRTCWIDHIPLGREFAIKVTVPRCMKKVARAVFEVPGWAGDLAIENSEVSASDATLQFASVRPGQSEPGGVMGVTGKLMLKSEVDPGEWCQ
nr:vWA domain-containing protein [Enhygromyxa salina]